VTTLMPFLAVLASPDGSGQQVETDATSGLTTLALIALALVAWWVVKRVLWPERPCRSPKCKGGRIYAPDGKSWRRHGKCNGKGYID